MASVVIIGLSLLMTLCGSFAAGDRPNGGCSDCCKRIDDQTTVLKRISDTTEKMVSGIREIEEELDDDIPAELEKLAVNLKEMNESVSESLEKLTSLVKEMHDSLLNRPKDCSDVRALGHSANGVYRIYPESRSKRIIQADVYCDMTTSGGNWLVFQRRKDGSMSFERTWIEYTNGFGDPSGEFWLGNELLYLLTSNRKYKLRIDMEDFDGQKRYAEYSTFSISSSADKYKLTVGGYIGNAGDSFSQHNGMKFSTKDADNDTYRGSCSQQYRGAWWYGNCHYSSLNGLYLRGTHKSFADGIEWHAFRGYYYSLKTTEMKIAVAN